MWRLLLALLAAATALAAGPAAAHKPSDSYLGIAVEGSRLLVQWDIAIRDLDYALGLDRDDDGAVTWGELRALHGDIAALALSRLSLQADGAACTPGPVEHLVDDHSDGAYAVLRFAADCPAEPEVLAIRYGLFFAIDPQHRGLLSLRWRGRSWAEVFSPRVPQIDITAAARPLGSFIRFFADGVRHILAGADHLLFILVLLLPATLRRQGRDWRAADRLGHGLVQQVKILTAFTLAHAATLTAAVTGAFALPTAIVEPAIALTIAATAIDNITPFLGSRRWLIAFGFGLVHGFGFAASLGPMDLPPAALALALLAFNLGIEAVQVAIVFLALPLAVLARRVPAYAAGGMQVGSAVAASVAAIWFADRAFGLGLPGL